ncbi:hypothetical protein B0H10DRAFT_2041592 [Mycena sp. CBHHK59/15]|nr:hypothetical protein B0H10DRAFT_2041592 [Mycena sp. CBHHK59/15]
MFTPCHPSPQMFTGFGVQNPTNSVTFLPNVHSVNQPALARAALPSGDPKTYGAQEVDSNI